MHLQVRVGLLCLASMPFLSADRNVAGQLTDPQGKPVAGATLRLPLGNAEALILDLQFVRAASHTDTVTVTADVKNLDIQNPDQSVEKTRIIDSIHAAPSAK